HLDHEPRLSREEVDDEVTEDDLTSRLPPRMALKRSASDGVGLLCLVALRVHEAGALLKECDARRRRGETMRHEEVLSPGDGLGLRLLVLFCGLFFPVSDTWR